MKTEPLLLPIPPIPYEYALISPLAYQEGLTGLSPQNDSPSYSFLAAKGWRVEAEIVKEGNHASIWVNDTTHQVVIAHRGSYS